MVEKTQVRISAVHVALGLGFLLVWGRSAQLQVVRGDKYTESARAQRTERIELPASRGGIYDRNGVPLALTEENFHLGIAPNEISDTSNGRSQADIDEDIRRLAENLGLELAGLRSRLALPQYAYFHGPFKTIQVQPIREIPGVHPEGELSRFYPDPDLARVLLGRSPFGGNPASGVERMLDSILTGVPGSAVVLRDQRGRRFQSPGRLDAFPSPGMDVFLTIDAELQEIVEAALVEAVAEYEAIGGDVVVMNPHTGEILALASTDSAGTPGLTALTHPYEPGSTAKLFAAAALLEHGLVSLTDSVWGEEGTYEFGGRTVSDVHEVEWATLADVIENSSNIGIIKFTRKLEANQQYQMLRNFGFGTPTGLEFPSESRGILRLPREWSGFSSASIAMGYEFSATPLQIASAYSAIANDGLLLRPTLIKTIRTAGGEVTWTHAPEPVRQAVSSETAEILRQMLRGVVYRGSPAALASYEVAGKTGTTRRVGEDGSYVTGAYNASFASLFPADDPQIVMVVKMTDPTGTYGGQTAAPVTRSVLERVLAAQTSTLDRTSLSRNGDTVRPRGLLESGQPPDVVNLPLIAVETEKVMRVIPDLVGQSMREAAAHLHGMGFAVRLEGWGLVVFTVPAVGDSLMQGESVVLHAETGE